MIRLFAALSLPDDVADALGARQADLPGAQWRPREALHVTLRFFGEVREDVAEDLDAELATLRGAPLSLTLKGAGAFGEPERMRAVWAGVEPNEPLRVLAGRCEAAARRAGLPPETRTYRPHVTLAYLRRADPQKVAAWVQANNLLRLGPFETDRFGLYSSWSSSEGSHYDLEREYPLVDVLDRRPLTGARP